MTATFERNDDVITDLSEPVMFSDPFPRYAELRRNMPVSRVRSRQLLRNEGYMLTRYNDVMFLHSDPRFSSDIMKNGKPGPMKYLPRMFRLLTDSMVFKDDPDHARLRRLVNQAFTPRMIQAMTDDIERIVADLLDKLSRHDVVDLVRDFAIPLPLSVISRMLGVSDVDRERFSHLMERMADGTGSGSALEMIRAMPSGRRLLKMIDAMAERRRTDPDDALISSLVAASDDGDRLSEDEIAAMIFLLMLAGHDTTANLIGSSILTLLEHPEEAERLREDPSLAASAIEELLRFTTPVPCGAARITLDDVEVADVRIPKGSSVLGMIISANRDETIFENPDVLDLRREPNKHLTFAFGKHFCLGNQLARMEGRIAVRELLQRFPNMQLSVPREQLRYKASQSLRGLRGLPLQLN
jgi:cytochrome P450